MPLFTRSEPSNLPASEAAGTESCPKCKKALVDPAGLGWCSGCGYCKSLAEEPIAAAASSVRDEEQPLAPPPTPAAQSAPAMSKYGPIWLYVLVVVVAQAMGLSMLANRDLPPGATLERAMWCAGQIVVGILLLFLAQGWLLLQIAPEVATLSFKDAILPFKLWPLAVKRLPRNQLAVWIAGFGLTLVLGAFGFVGGLEHFLNYLPDSGKQAESGSHAAPAAAPASSFFWGSSAPTASPANHTATVPVD